MRVRVVICACLFVLFAPRQENRLLHERKEAEKRCNVKMWAERRLQKVRANLLFCVKSVTERERSQKRAAGRILDFFRPQHTVGRLFDELKVHINSGSVADSKCVLGQQICSIAIHAAYSSADVYPFRQTFC